MEGGAESPSDETVSSEDGDEVEAPAAFSEAAAIPAEAEAEGEEEVASVAVTDMATGKIALSIWLGLAIALWTLHPLFFVQARGIQLLAALTGLLAVWGWLGSSAALIFWSALTGLINATLALVLSAYPPNLWAGLSAGLLLFALLDGHQRWSYVRSCELESGMFISMLEPFIRVSALAIVVGFAIGTLLLALHTLPFQASYVGTSTIVGAALFAGAFTLFLLHTNRRSDN
ncbi:hypothetical protein C2W62_19780 [Candidatus Entotheonella serta]|nr:hypothetical protein C2W62_19780 [Candidatus Entotheonella serta]